MKQKARMTAVRLLKQLTQGEKCFLLKADTHANMWRQDDLQLSFHHVGLEMELRPSGVVPLPTVSSPAFAFLQTLSILQRKLFTGEVSII